MKTYVGLIVKLQPNQIFVFGSNTQGIHGAGAAKFALKNCGAVLGIPRGRQGQAYAVVTKDLTKDVHPSVSQEEIIAQIKDLYEYARQNPELEFLVAYTASGTNLNYYTNQQMADMFSAAGNIPDNMVFEREFSELIT